MTVTTAEWQSGDCRATWLPWLNVCENPHFLEGEPEGHAPGSHPQPAGNEAFVEREDSLCPDGGEETVEAAPVLLTSAPAIGLEARLDDILGVSEHPGEDSSQSSSRQHGSGALSQLSKLNKKPH